MQVGVHLICLRRTVNISWWYWLKCDFEAVNWTLQCVQYSYVGLVQFFPLVTSVILSVMYREIE